MAYVSVEFYVLLIFVLILYYIMPQRFKWMVLLAGSIVFYIVWSADGFILLLITALLSYSMGMLISYLRKRYGETNRFLQRGVLLFSFLCVIFPWFLLKNGNFAFGLSSSEWIVPLGISFYTLQIVSYLSDVYTGKINVQKNPAKYALFIWFFPQIVQGPIPRYAQLANQLYDGHSFEEKKFVKGAQLILWGFFLKFMVADRAAVVVNEVFGHTSKYTGCYVLVAGILYSIELYADFLACVTISQGIAGLFGIRLADNFIHPYFSTSIKEFWRRWHISLSEWLRDYIYIPLGGSRKGKMIKYVNLFITFICSGIWHGSGYKFLFWGMMHAAYQVIGELTVPVKTGIYHMLRLPEQSGLRRMIQRIGVFFWVSLAWIIFRAESLRGGLEMLKSMVCVQNPWILFDDSLLRLGLGGKEWCILIISIIVLFCADYMQEKKICIREMILKQKTCIRWLIYITAILFIMVFGSYGFGYQAQNFIYGGF